MGDVAYRAPTSLLSSHRLDDFACRDQSLSHWLTARARKNHASGASRVFVVATSTMDVAGYYALAAGSVAHAITPGRVRRNMPDPIPVAVLARLATHKEHESQGIGAGMLKDAILRTQRVAAEMGIRALICHAIDENALAFYEHHVFLVSSIEPLTAMLPL